MASREGRTILITCGRIAAALIAIAAPALCAKTSLAGPPTYTNPVLAGDYPDPSMLRVGRNYYMTNTSEMYTPGLEIWHSRDLVHWKAVAYALKHYDGYVAAPCLTWYRHRFYIFYTPGRSTHVVWAKHIQGPWSKPIKLQRAGQPFAAFDPSFIINKKGLPYLVGAGDFIVRLKGNGLSVVGRRHFIYRGWPIPKKWDVECGCLESPKILRHNNYYYLFSAEGGTSGPPTSHMVVLARARHLQGPWKNSPYNPLVHTYSRHQQWWSTGHGSAIKAPDGKWYVYFHGYRRHNLTLGRSVLLEPVRWTANGWLKLAAGAHPGKPLPYPGGGVVPEQPTLSDHFTGSTLGMQWRFWKKTGESRVATSANGLVLKALGPGMSASPPMVCITDARAYQVQVQVRVRPGAKAGLLLFYNPHEYVSVGIGDGSLWFGQQGHMGTAGSFAGKDAVLKIVNDHNAVEFFAGASAKALHKVGVSLYVGGYTHQTFGSYLSLRPGLYCVGKNFARFRDFTFHRLRTQKR